MKNHTFKNNLYRCQFYDNGVIYFLSVSDSPNLIPDHDGWGCEIGNWRNFFSQLRHGRSSNLIANSGDKAIFRFKISLGGEKWEIVETLEFYDDSLTQSFEFTVLSETAKLGDLVNRFVFKKEVGNRAAMNDKMIEHHNTNTYYQVAATNVAFDHILVDRGQMTIPSIYNKAFDKTIYLRDEPKNKWVVHARLIASSYAAGDYVARWFYPNILLSTWLSRWLGASFWRSFWWRARERMPLSPINLGSIMYVSKQDKFVLTNTVKII